MAIRWVGGYPFAYPCSQCNGDHISLDCPDLDPIRDAIAELIARALRPPLPRSDNDPDGVHPVLDRPNG